MRVEEHAGTLVGRSDRVTERREKLAAHAKFIVRKIDRHRFALGHVSSIDENFERAPDRIETDDIAVLDTGDRATIDSFGRDMSLSLNQAWLVAVLI